MNGAPVPAVDGESDQREENVFSSVCRASWGRYTGLALSAWRLAAVIANCYINQS